MKLILTTCWGLEGIVAQEVKEKFGRKAELNPFGFQGRVAVPVDSLREAIALTYSLRTIHRVLLLVGHFKIRTDEKGLEDVYYGVKELDLNEFLSPEKTFAIRSERKGEHEFTSLQIAASAGQAVIDRVMETRGYRQRVNLDDPDVIIRVDVSGEDCMVGIDMVGGESLHRRKWRVYDHPASLKGTIASGLVMFSGWREGEVLLDPMCGSGTIPIEAAHCAMNLPPGFFRKDNLAFLRLPPMEDGRTPSEVMGEIDSRIRWDLPLRIYGTERFKKHVEGAILNVKSARVEDKVEVAKLNIARLPEKFPPESVDVIITNPPYGLRIADPKESMRVHKLLFKAAYGVLREGGRLVMVTTHANFTFDVAPVFGFKIEESFPICNGDIWIRAFKLVK